MDLIQALSRGNMSQAVASRWHDYEYERKDMHDRRTLPVDAALSARYFQQPEFRLEVLKKSASPSTLAAYQASDSYRTLTGNLRGGDASDEDMAHEKRRLAPNVAAAQREHVDLGVFGIRLGEPLALPLCVPNETPYAQPQAAADSCISTSGMLTEMTRGAAEAGLQLQGLESAGISTAVVQLGTAHCPRWLGTCQVIVYLRSRVVEGTQIMIGNSGLQSTVMAQLTKKYGSPTGTGGVTVCRNSLTGISLDQATERLWSRASVEVSYNPIAAPDCNHGLLRIDLTSFRRYQKDAQKRHEASEPQL